MKLSAWGIAVTAAALLAGCGGRAHLGDDTGVAYDRIWQAQAHARPSQDVALLTADDARIIVDNHYGVFRMEGGGKPKSGNAQGGMGFVGGGGLLTPMTQTFGEGGGYGEDFNPRPIRLN